MTTKQAPVPIANRGRIVGSLVTRDNFKTEGLTHKQRIMEELKAVGMTPYGFIKLETKELPRIIHPHEHIEGVVYGRAKTGLAMLIATDCRVIFLDKKPFAMIMDEMTYDVVSGVSFGQAASFIGITLHTRTGDYSLRFVNRKCAHNFVEYIEYKRLEHGPFTTNANTRYKDYLHRTEY